MPPRKSKASQAQASQPQEAASEDNDTIHILIATDNHVGYNERDAIRGQDSYRTFDEIMQIAKHRDVDMVLLAGDLFHENNPSRQAMNQVMRSLRLHCFGNKPCQLEMLSDPSEAFEGAFNHVNYEDPDINVAIPVFSINGNHDDPSGIGHFAALDLLHTAGLLNYYGRITESDNIMIKPILLQKGQTKLALYGMSNVRDERLFRTFRDKQAKFFQPNIHKDDWFNLMSVHQNHHAYTDTGYLPESFLPDFMDLVIWGHEHECLIHPRENPDTKFSVIQPGSSVATSLMPGEAVPKHVAIISVTGKEFKCEPIRLKTVRPFVMKEIVLRDSKEMLKVAQKDNNRPDVTRYLQKIVDGMIVEAEKGWKEQHGDTREPDGSELECPKPLIRLRVEYTAPEGGRFECENPQRFSSRYSDRVANVSDVVQFHRKKTGSTRRAATAVMPEESALEELSLDTVKVEQLVKELLDAQSLTILPQNPFSEAVTEYVDKGQRDAIELFVNVSLANQMKHLLQAGDVDEDEITEAMNEYKQRLEDLFTEGLLQTERRRTLKPRPEGWRDEINGPWENQPEAVMDSVLGQYDDIMRDDAPNGGTTTTARGAAGGRGRGRGGIRARSRAGAKAGTTRATAATKKATTGSRKGKAPAPPEEEIAQDHEVVTIPDDDDDGDQMMLDRFQDSQPLFVGNSQPEEPTASSSKTRSKPTKATAAKSAPTARQSKLTFSQATKEAAKTVTGSRAGAARAAHPIIDDDDDSDEPAFETAAVAAAVKKLPPRRAKK